MKRSRSNASNAYKDVNYYLTRYFEYYGYDKHSDSVFAYYINLSPSSDTTTFTVTTDTHAAKIKKAPGLKQMSNRSTAVRYGYCGVFKGVTYTSMKMMSQEMAAATGKTSCKGGLEWKSYFLVSPIQSIQCATTFQHLMDSIDIFEYDMSQFKDLHFRLTQLPLVPRITFSNLQLFYDQVYSHRPSLSEDDLKLCQKMMSLIITREKDMGKLKDVKCHRSILQESLCHVASKMTLETRLKEAMNTTITDDIPAKRVSNIKFLLNEDHNSHPIRFTNPYLHQQKPFIVNYFQNTELDPKDPSNVQQVCSLLMKSLGCSTTKDHYYWLNFVTLYTFCMTAL